MLQAPSWLLASHGDDVTFTIHNRVKIHNLNQKKLKTIYFIKRKKKINQSSRLLPPSMLWTRIFHVRSHSIDETHFLFGKNWFLKKSWSRHLFYFYFEGKIKQERKTLKCDSIIFGKSMSLKKPESRSKDQVTYWEGTARR